MAHIFRRLTPAKTTPVYDTYWKFATERQEIFYRRLFNGPPPWTKDEILQNYKFTNVYRACDRVSQYLLRHVLYEGPQDPGELFFRTLLFKTFNRIETWELLKVEIGTISREEFSVDRYDAILTKALESGKRLYSAAYIMPTGGKGSQPRKHRMHLELIQRMLKDDAPDRIAGLRSMRAVFEVLASYPTVGTFLAYQYATDLNYSTLTNFSEMEFVAPGPGALDGISKCFSNLGGLNASEIIRVVADRQEVEFQRLGLHFQTLGGRPLQLIDCQNLFCEVSKYARLKHPTIPGLSGRTRIKQRFTPKPLIFQYFFPPKWGILNDKVSRKALHIGCESCTSPQDIV